MAVDYTTEADPNDLEIASYFTTDKTIEEIEKEQEGKFKRIPAGEHLLRVMGVEGMWNKPDNARDPIRKDLFEVFVDGKPRQFESHKLYVRFCLADDPDAQITDMMVLPPPDPKHKDAYLRGSKKSDAKQFGFWANKFTFFINRIGWPFGPGETIPAEACRTANWKGKLVFATVVVHVKQEEDKTTREMVDKEGYPEIKSFSYRSAGDAQGSSVQPKPASAPKEQPKPTTRATRPAPANGLSSL